jgi:hypothetical protein
MLSVCPGLGQVYVGYYQQGFINIIVVASLIALLAKGIGGLQPLAGVFLAFFWLYNIIDAARRASLYNQALAGIGAGKLPEEPKLLGNQGSLVGGILLIGLGLVTFSHTKLNVPLDWLEDWWPLALVGIGAWLVFRFVQERQSQD